MDTATTATATMPRQAQKPARQPSASTSQASGLAVSSMPELPMVWIRPDHRPKRCALMARAAKVIGHIIMPEQPMPSTTCAPSIVAALGARAARAAPRAAMASKVSATGRTPCRSSATPTGSMASAKAAGKAPVMAASSCVVIARSRASTSAATAGSVRTALEKTWPRVSASSGQTKGIMLARAVVVSIPRA
jgi:hypothetical protein